MTDFAADTLSTTIDTDAGPSASGGGQVPISEVVEPGDLRSDLEAVFKADAKEAKEAKVDVAKPEAKEPVVNKDAEAKEAPAKPAEDDKAPVEGDEPTEDANPAEKQAKEPAEKSRYPEAPAKFLPDAKEKWTSTPRTVQRDIARMTAEHEQEVSHYRESQERYESVRQYDEMAERSGTTLKEALGRYVNMEQSLRSDPVTGFKALLDNMGIQPQQAVSYIMGAAGISPQALAQHIDQNPDAYVARAMPQQQQAPAEDPRISQLQQQLAQMQEQQLAAQVIEPFMAEHPRYAELEQDIAFFLQSGKIPDSLSAPERLEAAYYMADRINPASHVSASDQQDRLEPETDRRADQSFSGSKSIKSAPGSVTQEVENHASAGESIRDSIRKVSRQLTR